MDLHIACSNGYYCTMFPWRRDDGSTQWVSVASSVEPQVRVLQSRRQACGKAGGQAQTGGQAQAGGQAQDDIRALLASVKGRFMQDLKLLPVRAPSHRVERRNTSVYVDRDRGQVLLCYAPAGDPDARVEFMAFGLRA
jgi:single-stranded DNA-binding protein